MALSQDVLFKFLGIDAGAGAEFDRMGAKAEGLGSKTGIASKALLGVGVAAAAVAATVIVEGTKMAAGYQSALERLHTGASESTKNMLYDQQALLKLAPQMAQSATSMAQALYPINSAGFHGAEGIKVLTVAIEGAKADGADIGTVADAVTSALNAYGLGANKAKGVTNEFVKAVSLGKVPMQDLAASIGMIAPEAADLHVPLSQVLAGISTMTSTGTTASRAAQAMRFALASLANPTAKAAGELKIIGLNSASLGDTITKHGLVAGFLKLEDAVGNKFPKGSHQYLAALANIVGGTRGLNAVLGLTGQHMATFNSDSKKITGSLNDTGKSVAGWSSYTKTFQYNLDRAKAAVNSLMIELGDQFLPVATKALQWLGTKGVADLDKLINWLDEHKGDFAKFAAAVVFAIEAMETAFLSWAKAFIDGAAFAMGWIPEIGPKLKSAQKSFDGFYDATTGAEQSWAKKLYGIANGAGVNLGRGMIGGINSEIGPAEAAAAHLSTQVVSEINRAGGMKSPSTKTAQSGRWIAQGLMVGMKSEAENVKKSAASIAKLLFEGLNGGWRGEAAHIKDALTTPVQNALAKLNSMLDAQESKDKARVKSAESTLKQAIANRKSSIASLKSSIAGGSDISGVLNQTDINGNSYTGNVGQFLSAQIGPLRTEAKDLALLRKKGLSQALLSQISAMSPTDAVSVMQQIISGQDGSIASLNASESAIQKYAKQSASTVVNSPAEKRAIARDKEQVKVAKEQLKKLDHIANLLEHRVAGQLAAHLTVDGNGKVHWNQGTIKEMVKELNKELQAGRVKIRGLK